jgi:hypothetical protein
MTSHQLCPGCGLPFERVRPNQTHCRPSCRVRHEHTERQAKPALFPEMTLESEWDEGDAAPIRERLF